MDSVPGNDVMCAEQPDGLPKLRQIELTVAICKEDVVELRSIEPRADGYPVSTVLLVDHGFQFGHDVSQPCEHTGRPIGASIIHDDDLELRSKNTSYLSRLVDDVRDVAFLIETGNDDGKMHRK